MKRSLRKYKIIILICLLLQASCSSYREVSRQKKAEFPERDTGSNYFALFIPGAEPVDRKEKYFYFTSTRYLTVKSGNPHLDRILNYCADEIIRGNYYTAEILLKDAASVNKEGYAENNLAVIYDLRGEKNLAFTMYSKALLLQPDNKAFRHNFLNFIYSGEQAR